MYISLVRAQDCAVLCEPTLKCNKADGFGKWKMRKKTEPQFKADPSHSF
jgi:hypothetical protein